MSPHNEVFQAIPLHASSYEANEPLIPVGRAEEEGQRLEEKAFSRCKISALLLGLLVGAFIQFSIVGARLSLITLWGEDLVAKSMAYNVVFSLLWGFFTAAVVAASLEFLRNLVTMAYSAVGGHSDDLPDGMVLRMEYRFLVGVYLAWTMAGAFWGMWAQTELFLVMPVIVLFWYKILVMCLAVDSQPLSSRRLSAEKIITAV
jgi:hypothetical protein